MVAFKKHLMLLAWLIPPIILGILTATILPIYQYFRVLFVLPAYLLLLAAGLGQFKSNKVIGVILGLQLLAVGYFWVTPRYHREDWRSLVQDLPTGANIAMPSRAQSAPLLYYGWDKSIIEPSHEPISGDKIYYIRYTEDLFDTGRLGQANFATSGYTISSQLTYPGIAVDIYENSY